jgi:hypothetical protein
MTTKLKSKLKYSVVGLGAGALMLASLAGVANAQATTTTTPGVPTTGAGGLAAANIALLSLSALAVAGGLTLMRRPSQV